jgi:hypothetical protein
VRLAIANVLTDGFNVLWGGNDDAGKRATSYPAVHCRSCLSSGIAHRRFIPAGVYTGLSAHFALHRQTNISLGTATMFSALPSLLPSSAVPLECRHQTS